MQLEQTDPHCIVSDSTIGRCRMMEIREPGVYRPQITLCSTLDRFLSCVQSHCAALQRLKLDFCSRTTAVSNNPDVRRARQGAALVALQYRKELALGRGRHTKPRKWKRLFSENQNGPHLARPGGQCSQSKRQFGGLALLLRQTTPDSELHTLRHYL